jgi:hypothetical protein
MGLCTTLPSRNKEVPVFGIAMHGVTCAGEVPRRRNLVSCLTPQLKDVVPCAFVELIYFFVFYLTMLSVTRYYSVLIERMSSE